MGTDQAGYEVWLEPDKRLLRIHLWGVWEEPLASQYVADCDARTAVLGPEPYVGLNDMRDAPIQLPVVKAMRGAVVARAVKAGLHRIAFLTEDVLSSWQAQRMAQAAGCKDVACFTSEWDALGWLPRHAVPPEGSGT